MAGPQYDIAFSLDPDNYPDFLDFPSDQVEGGLCELFFLLDASATYGLRFEKVPHDQAGDGGLGAPLAYTSTHPVAAAGIASAALLVAALNGVRIYGNMSREAKKQRFQHISQIFRNAQAQAYDAKSIEEKKQLARAALAGKSEEEIKQIITNAQQIERSVCQYLVNQQLEKIRLSDQALQDEYAGIYFNVETNQIGYKLNRKVQPKKPTAAPEPWYRSPFVNAANWFSNSWINKKVLSPVYSFLGLSSFAYWLLWIGAGMFTGQFDYGIVGVPNAVAFGLPFGFGLLYPIYKIANYVRNKRNKNKNLAKPAEGSVEHQETATDEQVAAAKVHTQLLYRRLLQRSKFELARQIMLDELRVNGQAADECGSQVDSNFHARSSIVDAQIAYLTEDMAKKTGMAFTSNLVGTYVGLQYGAWIVCDFLTKVAQMTVYIPIVNMVAGIAAFVVGGIYAFYKALTSYSDRLAAAKAAKKALAVAQEEQVTYLEDIYTQQLKDINAAKMRLHKEGKRTDLPANPVEFDRHRDVTEIDGESEFAVWTRIKKAVVGSVIAVNQFITGKRKSESEVWLGIKKAAARAVVVINQFMTGAFVARLFFVKTTAIFLPFAAAALSNPVTMGIVFAIGLVWAGYKLWEYETRRREQLAAEALKKRAERIECLKEQIKLADLSLRVLHQRESTPGHYIMEEGDLSNLMPKSKHDQQPLELHRIPVAPKKAPHIRVPAQFFESDLSPDDLGYRALAPKTEKKRPAWFDRTVESHSWETSYEDKKDKSDEVTPLVEQLDAGVVREDKRSPAPLFKNGVVVEATSNATPSSSPLSPSIDELRKIARAGRGGS